MKPGDELPVLKTTPDKYLTVRYAGASGDYNPIHIDEEFAKQVGLPGRILHGLWTMAQVARLAVQEGGGDPAALAALEVEFRGMGVPEQEVVVTAQRDGDALALEAVQGDRALVRNGRAELRSS